MREKSALRGYENGLTPCDSPRNTLTVIMGCCITMATHPVMWLCLMFVSVCGRGVGGGKNVPLAPNGMDILI